MMPNDLKDESWWAEFGFLTDMSTILDDLSLNLQGKQKLVSHLRDKVKAFKTTLKLYCCQIS